MTVADAAAAASPKRFVARLTINEHRFGIAAFVSLGMVAYIVSRRAVAFTALRDFTGLDWVEAIAVGGFGLLSIIAGLHWLVILFPSRRELVIEGDRLVLRHGLRAFDAPLSAFSGASVYDAPSRFKIRTRPFVVLRVRNPSEAMRRFEETSGGHLAITLQFRERSGEVAAALSRAVGEWD